MTSAHDTQEPTDALEVLEQQNGVISDLFDTWDAGTRDLEEGDSVETRWERGSAGKLLLQHLALRESAKELLARRLADLGETDLAGRLEADGVTRRAAIDRFDELVRGHQAITINVPATDAVIAELEAIFSRERTAESTELLPAARRIFGPPGDRDLASARYVRTHAPTHPSPVPRWFDRIGPLKAVRAYYDHLRATPTGGTKPDLDGGREKA
jgi:hypothetical protein